MADMPKSEMKFAAARVLIVEDNDLARNALASTLRRMGFATEAAVTLARGLAGWPAADIIITDIDLPDGSGVDLVRVVRESGRHVPVAVMTATTDEAMLARIESYSPDRFFPKPFPLSAMTDWVESVLPRLHPAVARAA